MGLLSRRRAPHAELEALDEARANTAAVTSVVRPFIANAAAKTAEVWWVQGFVKEEDTAFKKMVDDYEKQSGNKIEYSLTPYAALRQKEISAMQAGVVPDMMEVADFWLAPLQSWDDRLVDVTGQEHRHP